MQRINQIINIVSNDKPVSKETARILRHKLIKNDFIVSEKFEPNANLIICIGGDGSFLRTLHKYNFPDIPVIGINTGHLGFFQDIAPHELDEFIFRYKKGDYVIDHIHPLEGLICTRNSCIEVLGINEIVIKGLKSTTIHLNLFLDQSFLEKFSGDGLLISTPTGSTAYNYSLRGSIVDPRLNLLQITPIAPINTVAYRSFTSSIIVPNYSTIKIHPEYTYENSVLIVTDGTEYKYNGIVEVLVKLSELKIKLLRFKEYSFWNKVKEKFL
ncbi:NAD(+)/NADH kinase [Paramaledivibacter caminithermalis]|jgi:NAD+ kinase|uniref:NAD kinase n=1 Tax=Paramaledivibacter caminithermalis (strain DSM 15212 / CIP 107654 / DViRD3) TaxID=1121301 RepID=A0A1M6Q5A3_PARC5|nr:NAD(+)/NADH kinase [Paramaledivibacter caminithermalis]SHK15313.1 NAD+ kinase [Paramaledivibacter caminithermalis DSM 15212]